MSTEAKHTPGPWRLKRFITDGVPSARVLSGEHVLADVYQGDISALELNANANVIAAAPELADALTGLLKVLRHDALCDANDDEDCDCGVHAAGEVALAALRKAGRLP